jgi:hypothetical protein
MLMRARFTRLAVLFFSLSACTGRIAAQTPPADAWREAPPSSTGIAVGKSIPPFSVVDQNGQQRDFKSIAGPNGAMIVFQRSVDW